MEGSVVDKAAENARNLQLRAAEVQSKARRAEVTSILQKHPMAAGDVVQFLRNKGFYSEGPPTSGPKSKWQAGLETLEARKRAARAEAAEAAAANAEKIPTKYWTISSLSVRLLETRCLQTMDAMVFSHGSLTNIKRAWAKDQIHAELVRLLEFLTGIPGTFRLSGRALPIDYGSCGVFELRAASVTEFSFTLRTGANAIICMQLAFPFMDQHGDATKMYVEKNWSEAAAHLQNDDGTLEGLVCLHMLRSRVRDGQSREEGQRPLSDAKPGPLLQLCAPPGLTMPTLMQVATHFGKRRLESLDGDNA